MVITTIEGDEMTAIDLAFRLINGIITLYFAPQLYGLFRSTNRRFYLYWSLGYLFYGINIVIRLFTPEGFEISAGAIIAFFMIMVGFVFMVLGVGELIDRVRIMLLSTLLMIFPLLQTFIGTELVPVSMLIALLPYLFMTLSMIIIEWRVKVDLKLLAGGWGILFLSNLGYFTGEIEPGFVDLLSICGKILIYSGMINPQFSFIVDDLKNFLLGGLPTEYSVAENGTFNLVSLPNSTRGREIKWITDKVNSNTKKGTRSILISLYDLISPQEIVLDGSKDELYVVRVIPGSRSGVTAFEDKIMAINDDLNQIDLLFSDIINFSIERKVPCEIILYTFSHLIHTHGWKRVYSFITSKNPMIKTSQVSLTGFYYPESHEKIADIVRFEKLADKLVN